MGARNDKEARARRVVERLRPFFARAGQRRRRTDSDPKLRRYELFERWYMEDCIPELASGMPADAMLRADAMEDREAWHALLMAKIVKDALRRVADINHLCRSVPCTPRVAAKLWPFEDVGARIVIPVEGDAHDFDTGLYEADTQIASLPERLGMPPEPKGKPGTRPYEEAQDVAPIGMAVRGALRWSMEQCSSTAQDVAPIGMAVRYARQVGFEATRSSPGTVHCGCSLVAEAQLPAEAWDALGTGARALAERRIEDAWERFSERRIKAPDRELMVRVRVMAEYMMKGMLAYHTNASRDAAPRTTLLRDAWMAGYDKAAARAAYEAKEGRDETQSEAWLAEFDRLAAHGVQTEHELAADLKAELAEIGKLKEQAEAGEAAFKAGRARDDGETDAWLSGYDRAAARAAVQAGEPYDESMSGAWRFEWKARDHERTRAEAWDDWRIAFEAGKRECQDSRPRVPEQSPGWLAGFDRAAARNAHRAGQPRDETQSEAWLAEWDAWDTVRELEEKARTLEEEEEREEKARTLGKKTKGRDADEDDRAREPAERIGHPHPFPPKAGGRSAALP